MSKNVLKILKQASESAELLFRVAKSTEEEIDKRKFHGVICILKPSHNLNGLWTLEIINKTPSAIRVIKISAESFFGAFIRPNYSYPDHPSRDYIEPKANPRDEIILRNIESNSSLTIERELPYYPRNREVWVSAQISLDINTDDTFPIKLIKVTLDV